MALSLNNLQNQSMLWNTFHKTLFNPCYPTLTHVPLYAYDYYCVGANRHTTAKFRDYYPNLRRQHRPKRTGGFFVPVKCVTSGGLKSGVRGLQDGANRNKRVVSVGTIVAPGKFCLLLKSTYGVTMMTATTVMGVRARTQNTHAWASLPTHPVRLIFEKSPNGLIALQNRAPVAWIYAGTHTGQVDCQPRTCKFWDVAYHRQNNHGRYLETAFFDTEQEAIDFVCQQFQGGEA